MKILILSLILVNYLQAFYSKNFRKCVLNKQGIDIGNIHIQKVPLYKADFPIPPIVKTTKELQYTNLDFLYIDYIAAGGSGEVYMVEEQETGILRILKRFFEEDELEFLQENYIMHKMGYYIGWHHEDNRKDKPTLATYKSSEFVVLREFQMENPSHQFPLLFYKICKQLQKAHKAGITHHDMKMGNILIYYKDNNMKQFNAQIIDWNLVSFYYPGYEQMGRKGTVCYYPPEQLLRTNYPTPAIDIWGLAVVMFTYLTNKNPFPIKCKTNNIKAISSLVGSQKLWNMIKKYNLHIPEYKDFIEDLRKNPKIHSGVSLKDRVAPEKQKLFDHQLIDLFEGMFEVDPQYRLTISQVLQHPYFDRVKKLPSMFSEKEKQKNSGDSQTELYAPANNLVLALPPSSLEEFEIENEQN